MCRSKILPFYSPPPQEESSSSSNTTTLEDTLDTSEDTNVFVFTFAGLMFCASAGLIYMAATKKDEVSCLIRQVRIRKASTYHIRKLHPLPN